MADLYEQWLEKAEGCKGSFITNEEGRVVFIGGPGSGAGGSSEGGGGGSSVPEYNVEVTQQSDIFQIVKNAVYTVPFNHAVKLTLTARETGNSMTMYLGLPSLKGRIQVSQPITRYGESWYKFGSYGTSGSSKGKYNFDSYQPEKLLAEQGRTPESGYLLFRK